MTHTDLDDLARRPARYWTIDGLPELMLGVLWIVWGAAFLAGQALPHDWRWTAYWLTVAPVLALSGIAGNWLTRRLKARVTFPRAGYVEWKAPERRSLAWVGAAIVLAALALAVAVLAAGGAGIEHRAPAVMGVILSLSFIAVAVRRRTPYHLALAGAAVVLTVAVATISSGWDAMNWLFISLGAVCALVGAVRLARFMRTHPLPVPEGL